LASLASILNGYNNPGSLTVTGPSNYAGQTGVYAASNGLNFAEFDNVQDGANAIAQWFTNNVGSNPANSYTTIGEAANAYTGSEAGGANLTRILGVPASTPTSGFNVQNFVNGVIKNEGVSTAPIASGQVSSTVTIGSTGWLQTILNTISAWFAGGLVEAAFIVLGIMAIFFALYMFARDNNVVPPVHLPPVPIE
jgi:hypothetical protein